MTNFSHEHAEWIAPGNLMEQNFDSRIRIKELRPFKAFPQGSHAFTMFSAYALRENREYSGVRYLETFSKSGYRLFACFVWLCCASQVYYVVFWTIIFSVQCARQLENKNQKKIRALGSISGHNFDMDIQKGLKQEVYNLFGFLIHAFKLKIHPQSVPICLYRKPCT